LSNIIRSCKIFIVFRRAVRAVLLMLPLLKPAWSTDLTIQLAGNKVITRRTVSYTCDATGAKIGVPATRFSVEYITGSGNSLAVVPIQGISLIFSNISSASGARYMAQQYTWWESDGNATLFMDALAGKQQSICRKAP
jgi:membrane-bound inhibitor of C-type lysozyme